MNRKNKINRRRRIALHKVKNGSLQNKTNSTKNVLLKAPIRNKQDDLSFVINGEYLINQNVKSLPFLLDGIFTMSGLAAVSGSSDTGKSSFLRQLAIAIVLGLSEFLGIKLNPRHKRVLIVSTEDDVTAIAYLLNKQNVENIDGGQFFNLGFIFDTTALLTKLATVLKNFEIDCVIIDAMADLYSGDMNMANKIRSFIYQFQKLADKHNTLFIFLHHTKKGSQYSEPSKDNLLGSQGFEAKMRLVLELRKDPHNPELRYLSIVKGNYVPESLKKDAMVLRFDNNLLFTNLNRTVPNSQLAQSSNQRSSRFDRARERAIELRRAENLSIREIHRRLTAEGHSAGISTIGNWIRDVDNTEPVGYGYEDPDDHIPDISEDDLEAAS